MNTTCSSAVAAAALAAACLSVHAAGLPPAAAVALAREGRPLMAVVTSTNAAETTLLAARDLAATLARIAGAEFAVTNGDGLAGLAVGAAGDFPALGPVEGLATNDILRREDYVLRSHAGGVLLVGATPRAARHAVWDLLHRLGYRLYFAAPEWEVVPRLADLAADVDALERPDYAVRRIWYGWGTWPERKPLYADWCARNRTDSAFDLNTGHAYDGIRAAHKTEFEEHPEYLGLVGGVRKPPKFCIANPALRKLVADDAVARFAANPALDSVSVDPSDGGGWCECPECAALGSVSDRALTLANEVARAVTAACGQRYVGMYAYNQHSPPPDRTDVAPNVIISVATSFLKGGLTVDQIIDGWRARGSTLFGIREYYSVNTWDRDLPGAARGGNPAGLAASIPHFHAKGARFVSAESSDNWGPNGLGYYLAARMLWSTNEAARLEALTDDFLERCFGPAREPMRGFYALIDGGAKPLLSPDLVGRLYRQLDAAMKLTDDAAIRARLASLLLYTRYVDLYRRYDEASGAARQAAFEQLIRHAYRMRLTGMIHAYALYRDLAGRDKSVTVPPEAAWQKPERDPKTGAVNPWKSSAPFAEKELAEMLARGIEQNALVDFKAVEFGTDLVRPEGLDLASPGASMGPSWTSRGRRRITTWIDEAPATVRLTITGGLIPHYRDRGDVRVRLLPAGEVEGKAVAEAGVPPDGEPHAVELKTDFTGLHTIEVSDGMDATRVDWEEGRPMTLDLSFAARMDYGEPHFFFYVPRGTRLVGGFAGGVRGSLLDPRGGEALKWDGSRRYFSVPVPEGMDGKLWSFRADLGKRQLMLMTVPPFIARNADELLLPRAVVEADRKPR